MKKIFFLFAIIFNNIELFSMQQENVANKFVSNLEKSFLENFGKKIPTGVFKFLLNGEFLSTSTNSGAVEVCFFSANKEFITLKFRDFFYFMRDVIKAP